MWKTNYYLFRTGSMYFKWTNLLDTEHEIPFLDKNQTASQRGVNYSIKLLSMTVHLKSHFYCKRLTINHPQTVYDFNHLPYFKTCLKFALTWLILMSTIEKNARVAFSILIVKHGILYILPLDFGIVFVFSIYFYTKILHQSCQDDLIVTI